MKKRRIALLLLFSGLAVSCDDPDFGDQIYDFVHNNSRRLSVEHVDAALPEQWLRAHRAAVLELDARSQFLKSSIDAVRIPKDSDTLQGTLEIANAGLRSLIQIEADLDRMYAGFQYWDAACDSRDVFDSLQMDRISTVAPIQPVVDANYTAEVNTCLPCAAIDMFTGNYEAMRVAKQNERAADAIALYGTLAIHGDEMFAKSKKVCAETAQTFKSVRDDIRTTVDALRPTVSQLHDTLALARAEAERKLVPIDVERLLLQQGTEQQLVATERVRLSEDIIASTDRAQLEIIREWGTFTTERDCERRISNLENVEDDLVALCAQVDVLLSDTRTLNDMVVQRLMSKKQEWQTLLSRALQSRKQYALSGCQ